MARFLCVVCAMLVVACAESVAEDATPAVGAAGAAGAAGTGTAETGPEVGPVGAPVADSPGGSALPAPGMGTVVTPTGSNESAGGASVGAEPGATASAMPSGPMVPVTVVTSGGQPGVGGGVAGSPEAGGASPGGAGGSATTPSNVIEGLEEYLAEDPETRSPIDVEPFASVALTKEEAALAQQLLWEDYAEEIRSTRMEENAARAITLGEFTLRYEFTIFGDAPTSGRALYLSLHGGGETDPATNDGQWENQQVLYQPDEGVYLAPRGPTDTWNLWHQDHIDPLFYRLITNMIVFEGVDPNRVYVMGYSAGGDGVYQLAPRMADSWAAAAMMAGHPNDARPESLRNIGFALHVGGLDTAFDRNLIGAEWGVLLDELQAIDPGGYEHQVQVHADKPHWMDLEDAVAVPWMAEFTRNPVPERVVWLQDDVPHDRFYWLGLSEADRVAGVLVTANYEGQTIHVESAELTGDLELLLSDDMMDLDQAVVVESEDGQELYSGVLSRTIANLARTLVGRGDPALMFSAAVLVDVP